MQNKFNLLYLIASFIAFSGIVHSQITLNDALVKAKKNNKKIIVDIYTDWCGWCKKMDADVYDNEKVKKIIKKSFVFAKLDAESLAEVTYNNMKYTEQDIALYFEANGYPTTVFLEPDGKVIEFKYDKTVMKNLPGYFGADDFRKMLNFIKNEKYKDTDLSTIF